MAKDKRSEAEIQAYHDAYDLAQMDNNARTVEEMEATLNHARVVCLGDWGPYACEGYTDGINGAFMRFPRSEGEK